MTSYCKWPIEVDEPTKGKERNESQKRYDQAEK